MILRSCTGADRLARESAVERENSISLASEYEQQHRESAQHGEEFPMLRARVLLWCFTARRLAHEMAMAPPASRQKTSSTYLGLGLQQRHQVSRALRIFVCGEFADIGLHACQRGFSDGLLLGPSRSQSRELDAVVVPAIDQGNQHKTQD